jgi:hypothetical protein
MKGFNFSTMALLHSLFHNGLDDNADAFERHADAFTVIFAHLMVFYIAISSIGYFLTYPSNSSPVPSRPILDFLLI